MTKYMKRGTCIVSYISSYVFQGHKIYEKIYDKIYPIKYMKEYMKRYMSKYMKKMRQNI